MYVGEYLVRESIAMVLRKHRRTFSHLSERQFTRLGPFESEITHCFPTLFVFFKLARLWLWLLRKSAETLARDSGSLTKSTFSTMHFRKRGLTWPV